MIEIEGHLALGNLGVDLSTRQVWVGRTEVFLTRKEFTLLVYLAQHRDLVIGVQDIAHAVWSKSLSNSASSVRILMHRLRRKLTGLEPYQIRTLGGIGYSFVTPRAPGDDAPVLQAVAHLAHST